MDMKNISSDLAKTLTPLKSMSESHLQALLADVEPEHVFKGQQVVERGHFDQQTIYLLNGDLELRDAQGETTQVSGETSLHPIAHHQPRQHTLTSLTDSTIIRIDSAVLDRLLTWSQIADFLLLDISNQRDLDEDVEWMMTVLKSNLFYKVPPTNIQNIFSRLTPQVVASGDVILRQGEIGDGCYFIKEGSADVTRSPDGVRKPEHVASIGEGRCFGEDALVNETVRNATVSMSSNGVLMRLNKRDFIELLKKPDVSSIRHQDLGDKYGQLTCIDVRTEDEYSEGHLAEAVNIPLNLLRLKTRLLDIEQEYLVYCNSGRRSSAAAWLLSQQGFKVVVLKSGIDAVKDEGQILYHQDFVLRDGRAVVGQ